jgi:hypothetical protein
MAFAFNIKVKQCGKKGVALFKIRKGEKYMNELEFRNSLENLAADEHDNFAQQFTMSLNLNGEGDEPIYWHGRLIGMGDVNNDGIWEPYHLDFLGRTYTEKIFRHKLESDEITITRFEIEGSPSYVKDANGSSAHLDQTTVTYTALLTGTINGQSITNQRVSVTQKIRRTYLTYDTRVSVII